MRNGELKISIRATLQVILIYMMFMANESLLYAMNREIYYYLFLGVAIIIAIIYKMHLLKKRHLMSCGGIFLIALIFNRLINDGGIGIGYFFRVASKALIVYVAYNVDKKNMLRRYIGMMTIFAAISLFFFTMSFIAPEAVKSVLGYSHTIDHANIYSQWTSTWSDIYYGKFLYVYRDGVRNSGLFTEPGLYQMLLISGIYILLFIPERVGMTNKDIKRSLFILVITMITTTSTTGYMCIMIVFVGFMITRRNSYNGAIKNFAFFIIIAGISVTIIDYFIRGTNSIIQVYFFDKLFGMGNSKIGYGNSSGDARLVIIEITAQSLLRYPLGSGVSKFLNIANAMGYGNIMAGCGLFYYLAVFGIIGWAAIMIYIFKPAYRNKKGLLSFWVFLLIYIVSTTSQQYIMAPGFLLISLIDMKTDIVVDNKENSNNREIFHRKN